MLFFAIDNTNRHGYFALSDHLPAFTGSNCIKRKPVTVSNNLYYYILIFNKFFYQLVVTGIYF